MLLLVTIYFYKITGELNPGTEGYCDKYAGKTETNSRDHNYKISREFT